jgi:hypothetical protein
MENKMTARVKGMIQRFDNPVKNSRDRQELIMNMENMVSRLKGQLSTLVITYGLGSYFYEEGVDGVKTCNTEMLPKAGIKDNELVIEHLKSLTIANLPAGVKGYINVTGHPYIGGNGYDLDVPVIDEEFKIGVSQVSMNNLQSNNNALEKKELFWLTASCTNIEVNGVKGLLLLEFPNGKFDVAESTTGAKVTYYDKKIYFNTRKEAVMSATERLTPENIKNLGKAIGGYLSTNGTSKPVTPADIKMFGEFKVYNDTLRKEARSKRVKEKEERQAYKEEFRKEFEVLKSEGIDTRVHQEAPATRLPLIELTGKETIEQLKSLLATRSPYYDTKNSKWDTVDSYRRMNKSELLELVKIYNTNIENGGDGNISTFRNEELYIANNKVMEDINNWLKLGGVDIDMVPDSIKLKLKANWEKFLEVNLNGVVSEADIPVATAKMKALFQPVIDEYGYDIENLKGSNKAESVRVGDTITLEEYEMLDDSLKQYFTPNRVKGYTRTLTPFELQFIWDIMNADTRKRLVTTRDINGELAPNVIMKNHGELNREEMILVNNMIKSYMFGKIVKN